MKTIEIKQENALKAYDAGCNQVKAVLVNLLGKDFLPADATSSVKTLKDALKLSPPSKEVAKILAYNGKDKDMIVLRTIEELTIIARALNQGWKPNWNDSNEQKWYPYFSFGSGGFSFVFTSYDYTFTIASGGSRLYFKSKTLAEYVGRQFVEKYKILFD